jgi:hypothetical protein
MISFAKPVLTEDFYTKQKEEFSITCNMCVPTLFESPNIIISSKPVFSSEKMLHKNYDHKGSLKKYLVVNLKGTWS